MRLVTGLLAVVLLLAGVGASHAVVRIGEDRGGRIGTYVDKYQDLRSSGQTVIIDGLCAENDSAGRGAQAVDDYGLTRPAQVLIFIDISADPATTILTDANHRMARANSRQQENHR